MKFFYFKGLVQWGKKKESNLWRQKTEGLKFDDARLISAVLQTEVLSCWSVSDLNRIIIWSELLRLTVSHTELIN